MSPSINLPTSLKFIERDWLSSNQILFFDDDAQASLVDTGYVKHKQLTQQLINHACGDRPLTRLFNTHLHSDHCGGNGLLSTQWACSLAVPEASFEAARHWNTEALTFKATGQRCDRFEPTHAIAPGQTLWLGQMPWQVHAAPGHDPESVIFFQEDHGILISADALWRDGFGVIFPELSGHSGFTEQEEILTVIHALRPRIVLPGHGPAFTDVQEALARADQRLRFLRAQPIKHAQYALKVLVKFLMLDLETVGRDSLIDHLSAARVAQEACALLGTPTAQGIEWAIQAMVQSGQIFASDNGSTLYVQAPH